ncbi:hypothetical protein RUM43_003610 [Polyplax serrata]|uniref:Uncharacterized protein n=1 Tax=Polyplax serrata TaxID=468196 RepID=A0AAN8PFT1_POLSC
MDDDPSNIRFLSQKVREKSEGTKMKRWNLRENGAVEQQKRKIKQNGKSKGPIFNKVLTQVEGKDPGSKNPPGKKAPRAPCYTLRPPSMSHGPAPQPERQQCSILLLVDSAFGTIRLPIWTSLLSNYPLIVFFVP